MSGCTLQFARNSPLRTTLVDEATGHVKYKIDTPIRFIHVTRISKFDSPTQLPLHWDKNVDSDSGDDITDKGNKKKKAERKKDKKGKGSGTGAELPEAHDEIAKVHWKCFSSDRIVFRGKATTRREFLPKTGMMRG